MTSPIVDQREHHQPRGRRSFLKWALGGLGVVAAERAIRPRAAEAAPHNFVLEDDNTASQVTNLDSSSAGIIVRAAAAPLYGQTSGAGTYAIGAGYRGFNVPQDGSGAAVVASAEMQAGGYGLYATAVDLPAVYGKTTGTTPAIHGKGATVGVKGEGNSVAGVWGLSDQSGAPGVLAENNGGGYGLSAGSSQGVAVSAGSTFGIAVFASSQAGTALKVEGKVHLDRSGKASVKGTPQSPRDSVTVGNVAVENKTMILATIQGAGLPGVYVRGVVTHPDADSITIRLNKQVRQTLQIAWVALD